MNKPIQNDCSRLMQQLREIDFSIVETALYLDAYPEQPQALEYYHRLIQERKKLMDAYQNSCGPLSIYGNQSQGSWDWVKTPWPWEADAP
jgi:spore coat protein JB